jgi:hypothetical protein
LTGRLGKSPRAGAIVLFLSAIVVATNARRPARVHARAGRADLSDHRRTTMNSKHLKEKRRSQLDGEDHYHLNDRTRAVIMARKAARRKRRHSRPAGHVLLQDLVVAEGRSDD